MSAIGKRKSPATFLAILPAAPRRWLTPRGIKKNSVAQGQYIFAVAGGCACHTEPKGEPNAGARAFPIPLGTVYSTNLTSDKETGLGSWTDQQIIDAIVKGVRKDGSRSLPVMPYDNYSGMAQEDLKALIAYLRTLKPVKKVTPELKSSAPFARSVGTELWLKVFGTFYECAGAGAQERHRTGPLSGRTCRHLRRLPHAAKFYRRAQPSLYTWPGSPKR